MGRLQDRTNGQYLLGKPFAKLTWATGLDERGRPMRQANMEPTAKGTQINGLQYVTVNAGTSMFVFAVKQ